MLAFIAGVALASHIKSGRVERVVPHPLRWTMAVQAVALAIIGFVPASVPHSYVTVPICFLAAVQIGLFRNIGDLVYLPVATTGNLMRFVEAGYDGFVEKRAGVTPGVRGLRRTDRRVRLRRADRRHRQPGVGRARHLAARRIPCRHPLLVHHR